MAGSTEPGDNLVRMEGGSSASDELVERPVEFDRSS